MAVGFRSIWRWWVPGYTWALLCMECGSRGIFPGDSVAWEVYMCRASGNTGTMMLLLQFASENMSRQQLLERGNLCCRNVTDVE